MQQRVETADVVYFRPDQIDETTQEVDRLAGMLNAPPHIGNQVSNRQELARSLSNLRKSLAKHSPPPYRGEEIDRARARVEQLKNEMLAGMPTHEEMRVGGVGMADKHSRWEKKNKRNAIEWKNLRTRLHVTECEGGRIERLKDLGNVDSFRPWGKADATDAQIKPTEYHFAPGPITQSVIFNDDEIKAIEGLAPDIAGMLGQMTNEQRALAKDLLENWMKNPAPRKAPQVRVPGEPTPPRKPRILTEEQRQVKRDNLARARAAKQARKYGDGIPVPE